MTQYPNNGGRRARPPMKKQESGLQQAASSLMRSLHLPAFSLPDGDGLLRAAVCGALLILFALLQTTVFARFRPFGAIPDLMLPLVLAISMFEGERWGAVIGLCAALIIEALGASGPTLLPLLYMPVGYFCPLVTQLYLTDSLPVRLIYMIVCCVGRALMTLLYLAFHVGQFDLPVLLSTVVIPEFASTLLLAILPHLAVRLALHPFHRSRSERISTL